MKRRNEDVDVLMESRHCPVGQYCCNSCLVVLVSHYWFAFGYQIPERRLRANMYHWTPLCTARISAGSSSVKCGGSLFATISHHGYSIEKVYG